MENNAWKAISIYLTTQKAKREKEKIWFVLSLEQGNFDFLWLEIHQFAAEELLIR
jgi:hypothetical protein